LLAEGTSLQEPLFAVTQQELEPRNYTKIPMLGMPSVIALYRAGVRGVIASRLPSNAASLVPGRAIRTQLTGHAALVQKLRMCGIW